MSEKINKECQKTLDSIRLRWALLAGTVFFVFVVGGLILSSNWTTSFIQNRYDACDKVVGNVYPKCEIGCGEIEEITVRNMEGSIFCKDAGILYELYAIDTTQYEIHSISKGLVVWGILWRFVMGNLFFSGIGFGLWYLIKVE